MEVLHNERDVEFIMLRNQASKIFSSLGTPRNGLNHAIDFGGKSCETLATEMIEALKLTTSTDRKITVTVSEDGQFDGTVSYVPQ